MNTSKNWLWIVIIVVVLALAWVAWQYGFFNRPVTQEKAPALSNDTTTQIGSDLNSVDLGDPSQNLKQMEADINSL